MDSHVEALLRQIRLTDIRQVEQWLHLQLRNEIEPYQKPHSGIDCIWNYP